MAGGRFFRAPFLEGRRFLLSQEGLPGSLACMARASPSPSVPASASPLEWTAIALLVVNLAWTLWCLGGYRPETRLISGWLLTGALVVLAADRVLRSGAPPWHPAGFWLLPFLVYAAFNVVFVTPVSWLGWMDWWGWAQAAGTFWIAVNTWRVAALRRMLVSTLAGLAVAAVGLALYQRWVDPEWLPMGRTQSYQFIGRSGGPFGIPNSLGAFLALLLPAGIQWMGTRREMSRLARVGSGAFVALVLVGLLLTVSRGTWLALLIAMVVWPLMNPRRSLLRRLTRSGGMLFGGVAILLFAYALLPGVRVRLDALLTDGGERTRPFMWQGAWNLFLDAPVAGTGAGSFNVLFERHRGAGFRDDPQWAHNEYLNTLSDYGLTGFALAFFLPAALAARAWGRAGRTAVLSGKERAWAIGLLAFGLTLGVDFHLKLPALAMTAALVAGAWCSRWTVAGEPGTMSLGGRCGSAGAAVAGMALFAMIVAPMFRAESMRYSARRMLDAFAEGRISPQNEVVFLQSASDRFAQAVTTHAGNAQAWSDLSYSASLLARVQPAAGRELGMEAERAARGAISLCDVAPEFWWRLGVALDMQGRWTEAGAVFASALSLAPHHPHGWYYQAYHYSLNRTTLPLARTSLAICLRLDPGYGPAESLRESLKAER